MCSIIVKRYPITEISAPLHRIVEAEGRATILVLDDNMPLRSMRYEYYQLARKCKFKELYSWKFSLRIVYKNYYPKLMAMKVGDDILSWWSYDNQTCVQIP